MTGQRRVSAGRLLVLALVVTSFSMFQATTADNYQLSYQLIDHPDGSAHYRLNIAIPQTLLEYYEQQTHALNSVEDFARFVTPYALEPIAVKLKQIYPDDEDFSNAVLMIVHQISYQVTNPCKYPVETMTESVGDCDLLSYIAASIIEADGLRAVLFYYEGETAAHMNIGVALAQAPHDARGVVRDAEYAGARFYVAECTGGNWKTGWRVGEYPDDLSLDSAQVISLDDLSDVHAGQVSASYQNLEASSMSLAVSPSFLLQDGTITVTGDLNPQLENAPVTIYARTNGSPWRVAGTTNTTERGRFSYSFGAETAGVCEIRASWSGDYTFAAVDSPTRTVTILSTFFLVLLTLTIVMGCFGIAVFAFVRHNKPNALEPEPPQEFHQIKKA